MKKYEIIEHTADVGIKVYGKNIKELFENSALGMFSIITNVKKINLSTEEKVEINSENINELLVDWLNELLFKFDVDKKLFTKFKIYRLDEFSLSAKISGDKHNLKQYPIATNIKAVTYHSLNIKRQNNIWTVQIIFDI